MRYDDDDDSDDDGDSDNDSYDSDDIDGGYDYNKLYLNVDKVDGGDLVYSIVI
jgi:hypothetical protein